MPRLTKPFAVTRKTSSRAEDNDSDEEIKKAETTRTKFSWRLPAEESHSDWTIEIEIDHSAAEEEEGFIQTDVAMKTFHVHKCILAVGSRRSEYFATLFKNGRNVSFAENQTNTSRIKLVKQAADAFPFMLDYMYHPHRHLSISCESATALYYLGQYFENRQLRYDAKKFWQKNLSPKNCHIYYQHAKILGIEKINNAVVCLCGEHILRIKPSAPITHVSDISFWLKVLNKIKVTKWRSLHVSLIIAEVCMRNMDTLTVTTFNALCNRDVLPYIHSAAAKHILEISKQLEQQSGSTDVAKLNDRGVTCLESRCVQGLSVKWKEVIEQDEQMHAFLKEQKQSVILELMAICLKCSQVNKTIHVV